MVVVTEDTEREHDCGDRANRREYEEIRPIDPTMQDREMVSSPQRGKTVARNPMVSASWSRADTTFSVD